MTLIGIRNTKILYVMKYPSDVCAKCQYASVVFKAILLRMTGFYFLPPKRDLKRGRFSS